MQRMNKNILLLNFIFILVLSSFASAETTIEFQDDFNRANSGTVGNGWVETEVTGTISIVDNTLEIIDSGSGVNTVVRSINNSKYSDFSIKVKRPTGAWGTYIRARSGTNIIFTFQIYDSSFDLGSSFFTFSSNVWHTVNFTDINYNNLSTAVYVDNDYKGRFPILLNSSWDNIYLHNSDFSATGTVYFDDIFIGNITPTTINNFSITAKSYWDNSTINTFNATINGTTYTTTNGTITTDILDNSTSLYNITITADDWFNATYEYYNVSTNLGAILKQSQINITPTYIITNTSISNFTAYVNGSLACNTTLSYCIIYPDEGVYTVTIEDNTGVEDFHTTSNTLTVTALDNTTFNPRVHAHTIFVYARTLANATINNFSATINSLNISDTRTQNTTTGVIEFQALHQTYNISVDAEGYALSNNSQLVSVSSGNYTLYFYLYTTNSVNISFYDSSTGALINDRNVTIEFIGTTAQTNITSTGNLYVDLLSPSEYTLSYSATGYRTGSYVFTLENRSTNNLNLYLDAENTTSLVLITIQDKYSKDPIPQALVTIQRYVNSAWITEQIFRTDFNGQGEGYFVVSTEFYNFLVEIGDTVYFGVINSNSNKKVIYPEDVSNGIVISVDVNPVTGVFEYQSTYSLVTSISFTNLSNTTGRFTFFWDDTDNLNRDAELIIKVGNEENCTSSASSESGSITCNVAISSGTGVVYFTAVGYIDGIPIESTIGVLGQEAFYEFDWGSTGWIVTIFLTLIGFTMFLARPKISIFIGTGVFALLLLANVILKGVGGEIVILLLFIAFAISKIPTKVGE